MNTLDVLRKGIVRVLDVWRQRFGGADDALYWVLRLELADPDGPADRGEVLRQVPPSLAERVARSAREIDAYFDNVRYILLDPTTKVWGTLTNALRVAAGVDSVTEPQRATFDFPMASAAMFFRAAHSDARLAGGLSNAFKPMPAADCQTLAALFNPNLAVTIDAATVLAIVRLLGNEGPLTHEESAAFATLRDTGLVHAAFRGARGQG
jgi:hypothetical protein